MKALLASITARLDKLERDFRSLSKSFVGCEELDAITRRITKNDLRYGFERIKNLELTVFPNLRTDITALADIIGDDDAKAYNPHDFRGPKSKA